MISLDLPMSVWEDLLAQAAMGRALGGRRDDLAPRPLAWLTKNASITLVRAASLKPPSHPPERSFGHRPLDRLWMTKRPVCGTASGTVGTLASRTDLESSFVFSYAVPS